MKEIWLPIKDFEGRYEVSTFGNVRNAKTGRILKPQVACGYQQVYFNIGGKQKWFKIHRLVAETFIPVPTYLLMLLASGAIKRIEVNHKNENKVDNNVENLEWCTPYYNHHYGTSIKRMSETVRKKHVEKYGCTSEEHRKRYRKEYYQKNRERIIKRNLEYYYKNKSNGYLPI